MAEEKKKHPNPLIILMKSKKVIVIIIIVIILIIMFGPLVKSKLQPTRYISSSELEKIVSTSDLNVARITYNGIADVKNEKGKIKYYDEFTKFSNNFYNYNIAHIVTIASLYAKSNRYFKSTNFI